MLGKGWKMNYFNNLSGVKNVGVTKICSINYLN